MTNWEAAKREYVTGDFSYQDIADKYGASKRTVIRQAAKGNWQKAKEDYVTRVTELCHQKTAEKTAEKFSDYASQLQSDLIDATKKLMGKIDETMLFDLPFAPKDLKSMSSALIDLMALYKQMMEEAAGSSDDNKLVVEFTDWGDDDDDDEAADP